jgi:hypothetical protein
MQGLQAGATEDHLLGRPHAATCNMIRAPATRTSVLALLVIHMLERNVVTIWLVDE